MVEKWKGEKMKTDGKKAFTIVELLTAVAIIAIMVGILMPAMAVIKKMAKETKQKAQIAGIEFGIDSYKQESVFGEYPPSAGNTAGSLCAASFYGTYCGTQTLAEAMFGQDLLGFHPDSIYRADGLDAPGTNLYPLNPPKTNLDARKGPYLARENIGVFTPRQIWGTDTCVDFLEPDRYVICDVFTVPKKIDINGDGVDERVKVGTPILYFRANPSALNTQLTPFPVGAPHANNIYNYRDNYFLMSPLLGRITDGADHPLRAIGVDTGRNFYDFIQDPLVLNLKRPVRPDSFILISAGSDGLYGTNDDICNFDPNLPK